MHDDTPPTEHPADELLYDLVDDALDAATAADVRAHLARCEQCAALVRAATPSPASDVAPAVESMPTARAAVMHEALEREWDLRARARSVDRERTRVRRWRVRRWNLAVAASVAAVVLGAVTVIGTRPDVADRTTTVASPAPTTTVEGTSSEMAAGATRDAATDAPAVATDSAGPTGGAVTSDEPVVTTSTNRELCLLGGGPAPSPTITRATPTILGLWVVCRRV